MPNYIAPMVYFKHILSIIKIKFDHNYDQELCLTILQEMEKLVIEKILPTNMIADQQGCHLKDNQTTIPIALKEIYNIFQKDGWCALTCHPEYGGQGLPYVWGGFINEMVSSGNMAFGLYPGLTRGAYEAIYQSGNEELKALYLPKLASGLWTGTMNLTEAQAGTDLGLIRSMAVPNDDGKTFRISGQKIFISSGDHDLTENIIHLVLARLPDAPEGIKGISMFLVPKFLPDENGNPGQRNNIHTERLEEKMGIHGNSTCVLNYDNATGFLVGQPHKGVRAMFIMMNQARLDVAVQSLGLSEIACQNAVSYAKTRLQGRKISGALFPQQEADPLTVHPDVRRMLLKQQSFNIAARLLIATTLSRLDKAHQTEDVQQAELEQEIVGLLTPVIKAVITEKSFENTVLAQQVFGGHGYIDEWGMGQFTRDARITMIYEGANGVQALDFVGRKLFKNNGRALLYLQQQINKDCQKIEDLQNDSVKKFADKLQLACTDLETTTLYLMQNMPKNPEIAGAASMAYTHLMGCVMLGWMWLYLIEHANSEEVTLNECENLLALARYYMNFELPMTMLYRQQVINGCDSLLELPDSLYGEKGKQS